MEERSRAQQHMEEVMGSVPTNIQEAAERARKGEQPEQWHPLYSVYDAKAGLFQPPFCSMNDATAERTFADCVYNPQHDYHKHAADFVLYRIGEFEARTGKVLRESDGINIQISQAITLLQGAAVSGRFDEKTEV